MVESSNQRIVESSNVGMVERVELVELSIHRIVDWWNGEMVELVQLSNH